jgi:hypothetical protein
MSMLDDLLSDLGAAPRLSGAKCRGRHELFDPPDRQQAHSVEVQARYAKALQLCGTCPVLDACGQWYRSLRANKRPGGVVAGQVRVHKSWEKAS